MTKHSIPYVVAITGASGSVYGIRLVEVLAELGSRVALMISASAKAVIREELKIDLGDLQGPALGRIFSPTALGQIEYYHHGNFLAPVASGSYPTRGMFVAPCSTASLGRIAAGISQTLIERAAECAMKEGRKLVLVPRETPLSAIHLENMLKLSRLGVAIVPAMPAFYTSSGTVDEMVDFVVGKALDSMGVPHGLFRRWTGAETESDLEQKGSQ